MFLELISENVKSNAVDLQIPVVFCLRDAKFMPAVVACPCLVLSYLVIQDQSIPKLAKAGHPNSAELHISTAAASVPTYLSEQLAC